MLSGSPWRSPIDLIIGSLRWGRRTLVPEHGGWQHSERLCRPLPPYSSVRMPKNFCLFSNKLGWANVTRKFQNVSTPFSSVRISLPRSPCSPKPLSVPSRLRSRCLAIVDLFFPPESLGAPEPTKAGRVHSLIICEEPNADSIAA